MTENTYSLLHISDLHKRDDDEYDNLLHSMNVDCEKYISQYNIPKPKIIIVSGDIIRGGKPEEIKSQYVQASKFLNNLTGCFLENDKNRIIIVPGNHDVDWNISKTSMSKSDNRVKVLNQIKENSKIRWSWDELCPYRIIDEDMYNSRMDSFTNFYDSFYDGIKSYTKNPKEQYQIFDIPDLNIACVAYNSCYRNDHLNSSGCINPSCLTKSSDDLKNLHKLGRLLIGVWHHHTTGLPDENNYLDNRILKSMIDNNIQIGLFGHQHLCNIVNEYKSVVDDRRMLLISAGTLYGDKRSLPPNTQRQYNILMFHFDETEIKCRILIREDKSQSYEIPMWDEGRIDGIFPSWSTSLISPKQPDIETLLNQIIVNAEKDRDTDSAIEQLKKMDITNASVRKILLEFLNEKKEYKLICQYYEIPQNNTEAISLMEAAFNLGDKEKTRNVLSIPFIYNNQDSAVREQRNHLNFFIKDNKYGTN